MEEVIFSLSKVDVCDEICDTEAPQDCGYSRRASQYDIMVYSCSFNTFFFDQKIQPVINCPGGTLSNAFGSYLYCCSLFSGFDFLWKFEDGSTEISNVWNRRFFPNCSSIEISNPETIDYEHLLLIGESGFPVFTGNFNPCGISQFKYNHLLSFYRGGCNHVSGLSFTKYLPYTGYLDYSEDGQASYYPSETEIPEYLSYWLRPAGCTAVPMDINADGYGCAAPGTCSTRTLAAGTQCIVTGNGCGDEAVCERNDPDDRSSECGCQAFINYLRIKEDFNWKGNSPP